MLLYTFTPLLFRGKQYFVRTLHAPQLLTYDDLINNRTRVTVLRTCNLTDDKWLVTWLDLRHDDSNDSTGGIFSLLRGNYEISFYKVISKRLLLWTFTDGFIFFRVFREMKIISKKRMHTCSAERFLFLTPLMISGPARFISWSFRGGLTPRLEATGPNSLTVGQCCVCNDAFISNLIMQYSQQNDDISVTQAKYV